MQHLTVTGMAKSTVDSYACTLRDVPGYHDALADILTPDELLDYLENRRTEVSPSSLYTSVYVLKYYFGRVLREMEKVVRIPTPRKPPELGELLTTSELQQLITAANCVKHQLVIELLFGLGLRAGEVSRLRLADFDKCHETLTLRGTKGDK